MRRSTELECIDYETELVVSIFLAYAQHFEHPLLHIRLVDTYGTASELCAVEDEVVCICTDFLEIFLPVAVEQVQMLRLRCRERMVHCVETAGLVVPFEQREVHHPERCEIQRVSQAEAVAHFHAEYSEHSLSLSLRTAENEHQVTFLCSGCFCNLRKLLRSVELVH